MKPPTWLSVCVFAGGLAVGPAWGQSSVLPQGPCAAPTAPGKAAGPAGDSPTLRKALDLAWQRSVAASETGGQRRRAAADRATAANFWAAPPALELSHRNDRLQGNAGKRETEIGVAVPLWLPGQRSARAATANAAVVQAQAAEQVAHLHLAGELRELAWQLAALQAECEAAVAQTQALERLATDVERRVQAGDLARADALAAQAEQLVAFALQTDLRWRLQSARTRWTLLTGLTTAPELAAATSAAAVANPDAAAAAHPELQLANQSLALARQRVELMRLSRRDAPELTVGLRQDLPGRTEASQGSLVVALRLPFGTDDRNQALEAAARAELDITQTQLARVQERLDSEIAAARDALRSAELQLQAESARARLLRERANLIDRAFAAGEMPLPDQMRALAAAAQADAGVARQTAALGWARARLQQTQGLLP